MTHKNAITEARDALERLLEFVEVVQALGQYQGLNTHKQQEALAKMDALIAAVPDYKDFERKEDFWQTSSAILHEAIGGDDE
jgi:hypothetical protein